MAEVGALGYKSLRRASRIDLAGWAARSPSQAGSLTSPEVGFTPAGDPLARVSPRLPWDLEDRRPKLDSGLRAPRSSAWLGAETFPDKKVNRRRAAVSERFPAITGWRAGIPFFRNSIVQEARTARGRPVMSCALLWRDHRPPPPWMNFEHTAWRAASARERNRAIGARCPCTFRLLVLFDRAAQEE